MINTEVAIGRNTPLPGSEFSPEGGGKGGRDVAAARPRRARCAYRRRIATPAATIMATTRSQPTPGVFVSLSPVSDVAVGLTAGASLEVGVEPGGRELVGPGSLDFAASTTTVRS